MAQKHYAMGHVMPKKPTILNDEDMAKVMTRLITNDPEVDHAALDRALCGLLRDLGYTKTVEVFESAKKWYS